MFSAFASSRVSTNLPSILGAALCASALAAHAAELPPAPGPKARPLFDGKTLAGWEGNPKIWRVQDGMLTGGSYVETVRENEFLATTRDYTNFVVRLKIKLSGTNGFINSGFQIRSQRVPGSSEMAGYQCDYGEPAWYGCIYDESRRNRLVATSDIAALRPVLHPGGWDEYVIRAEGARVTTWINGVLGVDYVEKETGLPNFDWGKLGIQVHAGGKAVVQVKDITVEELPPTPPGRIFRGAPAPGPGAKAEPVSPEEEKSRFTLAPGFDIELIASEDLDAGFGKFVAVDWDQKGRLWTMTALEYPVDANESPETARDLYASRAKDKVLVYDRDPSSPSGYARRPQVFADGLAIPLGILPYRNGAYVQHGTEIVYLSDTNGDGRADKREVILGGFGVQDSHLFPHQFTRAPGNWVWFAQGAFNYSKVRTTRGKEIGFDQTRMARFRYDGSDFDITSQGPCNIWGLFMTMEGVTWIQEANDFGYPAMTFHEYANYPGCSQAQWKSYAPEYPGSAPHFAMGGTGLSGLAMSDRVGWPEAYRERIYIANPITRKIQAISIDGQGARPEINLLPDFVQSSDEMFRPVALRLGPDGCLYVVDWYNKIISHNEVARNHPDRDKKRGRIWRIRPHGFKPLDVPNFETAEPPALLAALGGDNTTQSHLAWQAIGDRNLQSMIPALSARLQDATQSAARRIGALWALEALKQTRVAQLSPLLKDSNANLRREAIRAAAETGEPADLVIGLLSQARDERDVSARAELLRSAGRILLRTDGDTGVPPSVPLMIAMAQPALELPVMKSTQSGRLIKTGVAYEREFERYLIRLFLEQRPGAVTRFLGSTESKSLAVESRLLAALAIEPAQSAKLVAELLPLLERAPGQEELLRLAQFPGEPAAAAALQRILQDPRLGAGAIEALLQVRTKIDASRIILLVAESARQLWSKAEGRALALRIISGFRLTEMEPALNEALLGSHLAATEIPAVLRALREVGANRIEGILPHVSNPSREIVDEAVSALANSKNPQAASLLINRFWEGLNAGQRRASLSAMSGSKSGAQALVAAAGQAKIGKDELDAPTLEKLHAVLGDEPGLVTLMSQMAGRFRPALRLDGTEDAWVDSDITLSGSFTVETWVKLDPGIGNQDGILGAAGALDLNFFDGYFRVWVGGGVHDAIISKKRTTPDVWTHLAVTRDAEGHFKLYRNGELDNAQGTPVKRVFEHARIGKTGVKGGTAGWLSEFRVWDRERTADQIRADFDRSYADMARPEGLVHLFPGAGPWGRLQKGARVEKTADYPPLLTAEEALALTRKFDTFRALAGKGGDKARGQVLFQSICMACHSVKGQGGQIGPVLNGAGAAGVEALLRNILTPNAAMEAGYRAFRIETKDGEVIDGIRVSEDKDAIVLRRPNAEDLRVPQNDIRKAAFTKMSMMPEGLLEGLPAKDVSDLFAFLNTLK